MCANRPPIFGLPSQPTSRPDSQFTPDRVLADGEVLQLESGSATHTLQAIHTPGHASNHLCLVLREDGLLFSGDHVLNGSTTIVSPPDGDMTKYIDSLDRLTAACSEHGIDFILPAHGHVLGFAADAIARLKAHRLQREAKVIAAMRAQPEGGIEDWVPLAYDDVPPKIWPIAKRSLLAHVERIRALALA
jgi:glyoxylase-like metal-dependent hydrolase (beta-lactamase superfamily II)